MRSPLSTFADFELAPKILETLAKLGFETPSPIQEQAIPLLKTFEKDFIGLAPTGTGKTAAFTLPLLNRLAELGKTKGLRALILCPTRELALQVSTQIDKLGAGLGVRSVPVYGGSGYRDQLAGLRAGLPIVVGTPGRVLDHLRSGNLNLENLQTLILDEADEMISMGFQEDIETVLEALDREKTRIWLFSATMSREIRRIADRYLPKPDMVELNRTEKVPAQLRQIFYVTRESNKPDVLCKLIEEAESFYGIVFCQTKALVTDVTQMLVDRGYKADSLHGDKSQDAREKTLRSFRDKRLQILVCTDVASRGIDVQDISHVVNYSIPRETENYVHRIGRTARNNKPGVAMSMIAPTGRGLIARVEKLTGAKMEEGVIPSSRLLKEKRLTKMKDAFAEKSVDTAFRDWVKSVWEPALNDMDREEIAARLLAMMAPELTKNEKEIPNEPVPRREFRDRRDDRRDDRGGDRRGGYARRDRGPRDGDREERRFERGGGFDRPRGPRAAARGGGAAARGGSSRGGFAAARADRPARSSEGGEGATKRRSFAAPKASKDGTSAVRRPSRFKSEGSEEGSFRSKWRKEKGL